MSRARVVDESIRAKAIELRSKGLSYREIARELGISVATAFRLVKSVEGASAPVSTGSANSEDMDLKKVLDGVALLTLIEAYNTKRLHEIEELIRWIQIGASLRLVGDFRCVWIDANGYCKALILGEKRINVFENPFLCVACPLYTPLYLLKRRS